MFRYIEKKISENARLARFVASGLAGAGVYFCAYVLATHAGLPPFAANLAAYFVAFFVGYALQRGWTFESRHRHRTALPRYFIVQLGCALVTSVASQAASLLVAMPPIMLALASTGLAGAASYVASILWVFPQPGEAEG